MLLLARRLASALLATALFHGTAPAQDPKPAAAAAPFEIREGDRVLLLGDALLERENTCGYLETRMHEQFPDRKFTVRNLSMSGDTPLGWSRASFDPPEKGFERLKEQIALVKPTVVFLGYGMAASLQEMTDRSGDIMLNPDPARYGSEPMTAGRFKKELGQLMDAIVAENAGVRFVLLSPIRHEDLRATRPGLPDPAEHNKLLEQYAKAIAELAKERGGRFVSLMEFGGSAPRDPNNLADQTTSVTVVGLTGNGVILNEEGFQYFSSLFPFRPLAPPAAGISNPRRSAKIRAAVVAKNALFFHRTRPSNTTYLFGFRKHEQGQNAKEIPEFDPLIEKADAEIDRLKRLSATDAEPPKPGPSTSPAVAGSAQDDRAGGAAAADQKFAPLPPPTFDIDPNLEVTLWAENPLLEKPTQMNWDAKGRAWVASSGLYPMIAPGEAATDKIIVLEDTDRDGTADKSTVFADGLLLPTGVEPDGTDAAYVGQSTELLHFKDTDGDGKADERRIVLSGFGTEDTHHIIHTLRWGPDGRLYFNQSIYIHSHLETPWGMVRLNSGGVFAYDPRTERVEVIFKGFCNPWGHAWDKWGQSFITDGAGFQGISWGIPGAQYFTYENARAICPSISPGSYPKFAGLELVQSPHFPDDWQGNAITCDFRAHRIVRFQINDLSDQSDQSDQPSPAPLSGYITKEMPDLLRTGDVSFRPIDVKLGPDGALYIADWSNPVINHGEVDFRDPRRDKTHGRIWRVSMKGKAPEKWEPLAKKGGTQLFDKLISRNAWEKQQAMRVLIAQSKAGSGDGQSATNGKWTAGELFSWSGWASRSGDGVDEEKALAAMELLRFGDRSSRGGTDFHSRLSQSSDFRMRAAVDFAQTYDPSPRVRLLAMRQKARLIVKDYAISESYAEKALATKHPLANDEWYEAAWQSLVEGLDAILEAALNQPGASDGEAAKVSAEVKGGQFDQKILDGTKDPHYTYAAWLSINDLAKVWTDAIAKGEWKADSPEKEKQLAWGLSAIRPELTAATLSKLMANDQVPLDGSGPWIELIGTSGGPAELGRMFAQVSKDGLAPDVQARILRALVQAARLRNVRPAAMQNLPSLFKSTDPNVAADALRLAGLWKLEEFAPLIAQYARAEAASVRQAAIEGLRELGGPDSISVLTELTDDTQPQPVRRQAAAALAALDLQGSLPLIADVLTDEKTESDALEGWRAVLSAQGAADTLASALPRNLPKAVAAGGLRAAREIGKKGEKLAAALTPMAGLAAEAPQPANYDSMAALVKRDGDPARGELIYRRAALACTTCHAIGGAGGKVGPDLTSLGASAPLDYIIESMLNPGAKVKEGFNAVTLALKDGTVATGIQSRETAQEIFLRGVTGEEQSVPKASIDSKENVGSIMPAGLTAQLGRREQIDLYAFLAQLGKPGVYDASKGSVARVWWLYPQSAVESGSVTKLKGGDGTPAFTLVDGRLTNERLAEALALLPNAGENPVAVARFQAADAGRVTLNLAGVHEAWLDGEPLAVASEPSPVVEIEAGAHVLAVRLAKAALPQVLRAASGQVRFLSN